MLSRYSHWLSWMSLLSVVAHKRLEDQSGFHLWHAGDVLISHFGCHFLIALYHLKLDEQSRFALWCSGEH